VAQVRVGAVRTTCARTLTCARRARAGGPVSVSRAIGGANHLGASRECSRWSRAVLGREPPTRVADAPTHPPGRHAFSYRRSCAGALAVCGGEKKAVGKEALLAFWPVCD